MEQRQAITRSTLFARRMHSTEEAGGGGGGGGRAGSSRYDRNRFARLDLGGEGSTTPDSGRTGLYGVDGRPGLGLYESVRLGLYDGGRRGSLQKDSDGGGGGGGGGRTPLLLYESLRDRTRDAGRVRSILDDDILSDPRSKTAAPDDLPSNGVHEFEYQNPEVIRGQGQEQEGEEGGGGGGRYGTTDLDGRFQSSGVDRLLDGVARREDAWRGYRKPAESGDVVYYRLIDNYMIYQLEAVDPSSSGDEPPSTVGVPSPAQDSSSTSSVLQKLLEALRLPSGSIPVDKKLGIIKNLKVLIEELQQKATKLQAEVEDVDTASSFESSKLSGGQSLGVSGCSATSCRHLEELESIRRQKASLLKEKCQLEEQIVQLRSVKSVVHDTDSEKRATKLEFENRILQNQLDKLRQRHDQLSPSPDDLSDIKQRLPQPQQTTSTSSEIEERINERVQRLKERFNLTPFNRKTNDDKDPAVAKTPSSSSSSSSANQPETSGKTGLSRLQLTSAEARRLADELKQTKQDCTALQKWLTGQVQTISSQLTLLAGQLNNTNNKSNSVAKNRSNNEGKRKPKNISTSSSSSSSTPERLRPLLHATTSLSSLDYGDDGKFERLALSSAAAAGESNRMVAGSSYDLHRDLGIINRDGDLAMNGERIRSLKSDAKDGIRVVCRIRPALKDEEGKKEKGTSCMLPPSDSRTVQMMYRGRMKTFEVDAIFNSVDSQQKVFEELKSPLNSCFDGNHVNFIAYGETGSGKSFTIQGTKEVPGLIHLVTEHLLQKKRDPSQTIEWNLTISITEIHNESIRDLLSSDPNAKLETKPNPDGSINTRGLVQVAVETEAKISEILKRSQEIRTVGSNRSNDHSTRSHLIVTITATCVNKDNGTKISGRVNLVDLAGSERIEKSSLPANDPFRFKEVQNITKSLTCLGDVLYAILSKQTHLPFRSSRLTHFLQESLGGRDSSTVLICQLVDSEKRSSETMSTLMFAQRVRTLDLPSPAAGGGGGGGKGQGDGSSGSRTPVEPLNQRPRRPSASGLTERLAVFSAAVEAAASGDFKRPGPVLGAGAAKKPPVPLVVAAGPKASSGPREGSESRNENRPPTPGSRPRSALKVLPPTATTSTTTTTTTTTPRR